MLKKTFAYPIAIACLLIASHLAHSKPIDMRPGLWELTTASELLKLAPLIPAEQMQSIQDLANEYGVDMPTIQNGAAITRTCITPEMVKQQTLPKLYQEELGCATDRATRSENNYQVHFTCNSAELQGSGIAQGTITSTESFSGYSNFNGQFQGNPVNEKAAISGKWIGVSCDK